MPDNIIIAENKYQQKIAFQANDHIGEIILRDGIYDSRGLHYIEKILAQIDKPVVFDIGANIGNHALLMSRHSQVVYLFEPQANIANLLRQTMSLNNITNWKICEFGLADEDRVLPLYKNLNGNNGASTFISELKAKHFAVEELQVRHGDSIVNQYGINQLDFIKIDVEGFEAKVIAGLKNTIHRFRPIIMLEWNNDISKTQFREHDLFQQVFHDYIIKAIIHSHHPSRWHAKTFAKIRRFFYKTFTEKKWVIDDFVAVYDYQHVLLVPTEKTSMLKGLE